MIPGYTASRTLVLHKARIHTMRRGHPPATALAVRGGRIVAVGSEQDVLGAVGADCPAVDLRGQVVLPGLTDAHLHWCTYALLRTQLALQPSASLAETLRRVRAEAAARPPGTWILGRGWDHARWPDWPGSLDLDAVAPRHPVALTRIDGHVVWLNSPALAAVGISADTPDPPGGEIVRRDGKPTGILKENALRLVNEAVPEPGPSERQAAMVAAWPDAWCAGITGCHDMGFRETSLFRDLSTLRESGDLGLRFVWFFPQESLDEAIGLGLASGMGDDWLRVGGLKLYLDGTLGSQSAHMLAPYEGQPHNRGITTLEPDEFCAITSRAADAGIATAVHAIGDAANRTALDGLSAAVGGRGGKRLRHRIEHVQVLDPLDVSRFAQAGIIASMQPVHCTSDMHAAEKWWGERAAWAYPWRALLDSGARLAFGSDAPIETLEALAGIHAAVTRTTQHGDPPGGWRPQHRIAIREALEAYTSGPAFASSREHELGTLSAGNAADLIVLDRDPHLVEPGDLPGIAIRATMIEGVWVWQAPDADIGGPWNQS